MQALQPSFATLSDQDLLDRVKRLAHGERQATVALIASLVELEARRLYLGEGCSSLFTYCTQVLRLSEHAAYNRIEAARAAGRFPVILRLLAEGAITLTTVTLLAPYHRRQSRDRAGSRAELQQAGSRAVRLPPASAAGRRLVDPQAARA